MADFAPKKPAKGKSKMPCCPNHGEPLEGLPKPLTPKGTGMCPISGCWFDYEVSLDAGDTEYVKDHNGNITEVPTYKVIGEEK